jgi:hypothetical protein
LSLVAGVLVSTRCRHGGSPPVISNVSKGQISTAGNTQLYWGVIHGTASEPGNVTREDAMVYDLGANMFVRSDARWDGTTLTLLAGALAVRAQQTTTAGRRSRPSRTWC